MSRDTQSLNSGLVRRPRMPLPAHQDDMISIAPLRPQRVQRADRRSQLLLPGRSSDPCSYALNQTSVKALSCGTGLAAVRWRHTVGG
jgi:hypothetical protein